MCTRPVERAPRPLQHHCPNSYEPRAEVCPWPGLPSASPLLATPLGLRKGFVRFGRVGSGCVAGRRADAAEEHSDQEQPWRDGVGLRFRERALSLSEPRYDVRPEKDITGGVRVVLDQVGRVRVEGHVLAIATDGNATAERTCDVSRAVRAS